jgi:hypothetical protein
MRPMPDCLVTMLLLCSAADGGIGVPVDVGEGGMKISMMTKNLRYGYRVFCLTIIVYVIARGPVVAAENLSAPSTTPPMLEVVYDHETALVSILARQTPLDKVLQEISKRAHLTIDSPNPSVLPRDSVDEAYWAVSRPHHAGFRLSTRRASFPCGDHS